MRLTLDARGSGNRACRPGGWWAYAVVLALALSLVAFAFVLPAAARAAGSVYVADEFENTAFQYDIDPVSGRLSPKAPATVATGRFPEGVRVTPDSKGAYVTNSGSDTVSQYDLDTHGALSSKAPATVVTGAFPAGVAVTPDGKSAYVTNAISNNVSQFDIDALTGALSPKTPATVAAGRAAGAIAVGPLPRGVPTNKDQCKNRGWRNFPQFHNQGQCVAFVERGPRG